MIAHNQNVSREQHLWINDVLLDHNRDLIQKREYYPPCRVDLKSIDGQLWSLTGTENGLSSVCRQAATLKLFQEAYKRSKKPNFECVLNCSDETREFTKVSFHYATHYEHKGGVHNYDFLIPDYSFITPNLNGRYGFPGEGDDSFQAIVNSIKEAGQCRPTTDNAGWAGNIKDNWHRKQMRDVCGEHPNIDIIDVSWYIGSPWYERENPSTDNWPKNFITYADQVRKWRYLIDIQGAFWSDRVKFFYFSNRLLFRIDRNFNEFYDNKLIPWEHYVPVKDFNDLIPKLEQIKKDQILENRIKANAYDFAVNNLTQESAIKYVTNIIDTTDWKAEEEKILQNPLCKKVQNLYNFALTDSQPCKFNVMK